MVWDTNDEFNQRPIIKVLGVGGGGCNAVQQMISSNSIQGVIFVAINTDTQILKKHEAEVRIQIGKKLTRGLGAGEKPNIGEQSALEDQEEIEKVLSDADMVFITAGMGGGTGTGAAPVIAKLAKDKGILTIGIVTTPFVLEGPRRTTLALEGIEKLRPNCDALIVVPNEKLMDLFTIDDPAIESFNYANSILRQGVQGISDIINQQGFINVDFADVRTVMKDKGDALMGIGSASGENRAVEATRKAIHSRLLDLSISGATDAIVVISSNTKVSLIEYKMVMEEINNASPDINTIMGNVLISNLKNELVVTVIATGPKLNSKITEMERLSEEENIIGTKVVEKETTKPEKKGKPLPDWLKGSKF